MHLSNFEMKFKSSNLCFCPFPCTCLYFCQLDYSKKISLLQSSSEHNFKLPNVNNQYRWGIKCNQMRISIRITGFKQQSNRPSVKTNELWEFGCYNCLIIWINKVQKCHWNLFSMSQALCCAKKHSSTKTSQLNTGT